MLMAPAALGHWLRLLWDRAPALHVDAQTPFLDNGAIHLAPGPLQRAAAAHAAAHLVYSPPRFDGTGLAPIARALLALLEDARVEALAGRELPGLARQWRALHLASPDDGSAFESLLSRLARALADAEYEDPHPWIAKGRRLFYADTAQQVLALQTPAALRIAAVRLGHDIGQMRLPFNARLYRPQPAYRDDHRWMWAAEQQQPAAPPPAPGHEAPVEAQAATTLVQHPEWDRLIARLRSDWCTVIEQPAPAATEPAPADATTGALAALSRRLHAPLQPLAQRREPRARSADAGALDLDALIDWRIARRRRVAGDARIYRGRRARPARAAVWLLVDQSASSADAHADGRSVLANATRSALAIASALHALRVRCVVAGFHSNGRHAVHVGIVKPADSPPDDGFAARLHALRPAGSTRLGAALRHAVARLRAMPAHTRCLLLLSDGQAHDIDMHDLRYLVEDARHALRDAQRHALRTGCLALAPAGSSDAAAVFGRRGVQLLPQVAALPRALRRLLGPDAPR